MRQDIHFIESPHCGVGLSNIPTAGQGLFALKAFKKNEVVADYSLSSKSWKKCGFKSIPKAYSNTCWWIGKSLKTALLASPESTFMRANHSRTPNTNWVPKQMTLVANKPIKAGEEITYDYRKEIAPKYIKGNPPSWA